MAALIMRLFFILIFLQIFSWDLAFPIFFIILCLIDKDYFKGGM